MRIALAILGTLMEWGEEEYPRIYRVTSSWSEGETQYPGIQTLQRLSP
jgi:hypothetical protein